MSSGRLFDEPATGHPGRQDRVVSSDPDRVRTVAQSALWSAYADALGWISELTDERGLERRTKGRPLTTTMPWSRRIGGRAGATVKLPSGCYSDDTQLRIATARAIGTHGFDVEAFAKIELPVWLGYALGGGKSTKAAASNLSRQTAPWFANHYQGWRDSGGNGAAMRIQPHVWSAADPGTPDSYLLDVLRNAICTHAHPVALLGAVVHAISLGFVIDRKSLPSPADLIEILKFARGAVPDVFERDPQVGQLWLSAWETEAELPFRESWSETVRASIELVAVSEKCVKRGSEDEKYGSLIEALNLRDPATRGSGQLTAIAAIALGWITPDVDRAVQIAANALGSDTDTIGSMVGALLGPLSDREPAGRVLDRDFIEAEARRMVEVGRGASNTVFDYPDLLDWSAPRTHADAMARDEDGGLHVVGVGPVAEELSEPLMGQNGDFAWQWFRLVAGHTVLLKRREHVAVARVSQLSSGHRRETPSALDEGERERSRPQRPAHGKPAPAKAIAPQPSPPEIGRVLAYLEDRNFDNEAIGHSIRRLAEVGSPEQLAVVLAMIIERVRR